MGRVWRKAEEGGAGAFDELQKSRPVINQARIRPGEWDPEHLLEWRGRRAVKEGGQGWSTPFGVMPMGHRAHSSVTYSHTSAARHLHFLRWLFPYPSLLPSFQVLDERKQHGEGVGATRQGGPLPSHEN